MRSRQVGLFLALAMIAANTAAAEPGGTKSKAAFALEAGVTVHRGVGTHVGVGIATHAHKGTGVTVYRGFHRKPPVATVPGHKAHFLTPAEARRIHGAKVGKFRRSPRAKAAAIDHRRALKRGVRHPKLFAPRGRGRHFGHRGLSHRHIFFGLFPGRFKAGFGRR